MRFVSGLLLLLVGAIGFLGSCLVTRSLIALLRQRVLDMPNERSSHVAPTPRGGGIAVVGTIVVLWLALGATGLMPKGNDGREQSAILAEKSADGAGGRAKADEDDGKSHYKRKSGGKQAGLRLLALAKLLDADAGEHRDVARDERKDAR